MRQLVQSTMNRCSYCRVHTLLKKEISGFFAHRLVCFVHKHSLFDMDPSNSDKTFKVEKM